MSDLRRPLLRATLIVAVLLVGLLDASGLLRAFHARARSREQALLAIRSGAMAVRAWMEKTLDRGGQSARVEVLREALGRGLATEAELLDQRGRVVIAMPEASPSKHRPDQAQSLQLRAQRPVMVSSDDGPDARFLVYIPLQTRRDAYILRLSLAASALADDWSEWNALLAGYIGALLLWLMAVVLVVWPERGGGARHAPSAMDAYEDAMQRLGMQEKRLRTSIEEERRRWEVLIEDKEAMTRAGELTAGIVHEVRNSLGAILGYARLIEPTTSGEALENSRAIQDECKALEKMIGSILEFVRSERPSPVRFDLRRALSRVVARESRAGPETEIVLLGVEEAVLSGDEALIERAFENLIRNAREAAGVGGHVWITLVRIESAWQVTIEDDGPGLSEELIGGRPRLFSTTKKRGLGLGLATAMKLVRLHDGEVALNVRQPRGVLVEVRLPIAADASAGRA